MAKLSDDAPMAVTDLFELIMSLKEKYRNVFIYQTDEQLYIYRALGRKEYREICMNDQLSEFEKEEVICDTCVLYPQEEINWDEVDAGLPTELMKEIRKNSYLSDPQDRRNLINYYRSEMYDLDNQITCIINEAFPNFDIEEIDQWSVDQTMKYLSRAEWKLANLHGLVFKEPEGQFYDEAKQEEASEAEEKVQPKEEKATTIRGGNKNDKLTPDKIREREEFFRKFPEFAGLHDDGADGIEGLVNQEKIDVLSPALRPGW